MNEYATSRAEMSRRKTAFKKLVVSFFVTASVFSSPSLLAYPALSAAVMLIVAILLTFAVVRIDRVLDTQSKLRICLTDSMLLWKFGRSDTEIPLQEIRRIRIKRTTKGTIREIMIVAEKKQTYINGLEDFEAFARDLTGKIPNIKVTEFLEIADFDHPLFYVFLGITVGIAAITLFRAVLRISGAGLKYFELAVASYLIFTGVYFLLKKPIGGRYGDKIIPPDYVFGFLFLLAGAWIIVSSVLI
ncbi:hypothetical protein SDC9_59306 [bioreactor metagenome]|uniref:Uncharacterized protein n=1 Tax=bioreactor metagenome TaxID=1076179 RepID=A0A644XB24_9ZZZZ